VQKVDALPRNQMQAQEVMELARDEAKAQKFAGKTSSDLMDR
jgi:hypothetical protein